MATKKGGKSSTRSDAASSKASEIASGASEAVSSKAESSKAESSKAESSRAESSRNDQSEVSATSSAKSNMSQSAVTSTAGNSRSYTANDNESTVADLTYSQAPSERTESYASGPLDKDVEQKAIDSAKKIMEKSGPSIPAGARTGRKMLLMRHAERMDRIFQVWLKLSFTDSGSYRPYDLNMPLSLPKRKDGTNAYHNDCPITEMGNVTSQMIGRGLRLHKANIIQVFSSPAFRCIQTASTLFKGLKMENLSINIEPGLFEWLGWYESTPTWMPPDELEANQQKINLNYKPVMTEAELCNCAKESERDYYERTERVIRKLLDRYPEAGTILIVGHGATVDAAARPLLGKKMEIPTRNQFDRMGLVYPYTCVVGLEELKGNVWKLQNAPIPPITYLDFSNRMDAEFFNRD